jgi:hypothetical protein
MFYSITENYNIVSVFIASDLVSICLTHRSDPVRSDSSLKFILYLHVSFLDAWRLSVILDECHTWYLTVSVSGWYLAQKGEQGW